MMQEATARVNEPLEKNIHVNGIRLTYFERGIAHRGSKPTLLFVHATGFHGRIWDKIIRGLGDYHSIAVDQRGHGRSEKKQIQHWDEVIADLAELVTQLDLNNVIGIGHSMGGHALVGAAHHLEDRFLRLIAVDPVIPAESDYFDQMNEFRGKPEEHPTARRHNEFDSPEQMADRLRPKGSYGIFDPEILDDYCRYGLLPNEKGKGYVLACPPEVEASVYMSSRSNHDIYEAIHALAIPVLVLRAKEPAPDRTQMDFAASPTWPGLADAFRNGRDIYFANNTHFLPMEIPRKIAAIITDEITAVTSD